MCEMSHLLTDQGDDHAEAADKHYCDAHALLDRQRFDGAAYLAGYVVECSLKTHLLLAQCLVGRTIDQAQLGKWAKKLALKPLGHNLSNLLCETTTPSFARYCPAPSYSPGISAGDKIISDWTESMRYRPASISKEIAEEFLDSATAAYRSVLNMKLDGVLE